MLASVLSLPRLRIQVEELYEEELEGSILFVVAYLKLIMQNGTLENLDSAEFDVYANSHSRMHATSVI